MSLPLSNKVACITPIGNPPTPAKRGGPLTKMKGWAQLRPEAGWINNRITGASLNQSRGSHTSKAVRWVSAEKWVPLLLSSLASGKGNIWLSVDVFLGKYPCGTYPHSKVHNTSCLFSPPTPLYSKLLKCSSSQAPFPPTLQLSPLFITREVLPCLSFSLIFSDIPAIGPC